MAIALFLYHAVSLGLIMLMQVPFIGIQPIRTSEQMAAAGVFALLNTYGLLKYLQVQLMG